MSDAPAAGAAPASPGARLRRAREARGWTASQVAELMRLQVAVIESLEADRYDSLGAAVFVRGHLRRYGLLLDIPVGPLLEAYDRSADGPAPPSLIPQASVHTPVREGGPALRLPAAAWYALAAGLLAAAGAGGYWWWTERGAGEAPAPSAAPAAAGAKDPPPASGGPDSVGLEPRPRVPEAAPVDAPAAGEASP